MSWGTVRWVIGGSGSSAPTPLVKGELQSISSPVFLGCASMSDMASHECSKLGTRQLR